MLKFTPQTLDAFDRVPVSKDSSLKESLPSMICFSDPDDIWSVAVLKFLIEEILCEIMCYYFTVGPIVLKILQSFQLSTLISYFKPDLPR